MIALITTAWRCIKCRTLIDPRAEERYCNLCRAFSHDSHRQNNHTQDFAECQELPCRVVNTPIEPISAEDYAATIDIGNRVVDDLIAEKRNETILDTIETLKHLKNYSESPQFGAHDFTELIRRLHKLVEVRE